MEGVSGSVIYLNLCPLSPWMRFPPYFHGSSSASLVGLLQGDDPGLKPTGMLLDEGLIPWSGELGFGISSSGVNRTGICAMPRDCIGPALQYADAIGHRSWTPRYGRTVIENLESAIEKYKQGRAKTRRRGLRDILRVNLEWMGASVEIEKRRIAHLPELSAQEKTFVRYPFPVVYGIFYRGQTRKVRSDYPDEVTIPSRIGLKDILLYVPCDRVPLVERYMEERCAGACREVAPLDDLRGVSSRCVSDMMSLVLLLTRKAIGMDRALRLCQEEDQKMKRPGI